MLEEGLANRSTGATYANRKSSRAHAIFQITLAQRPANAPSSHPPTISRFRVVDLAGSEKYKIPSNLPKAERDARVAELTAINGSLSALGLCVSALSDRSRTHVPFRNSKLTRVLSDSLSGEADVTFLVCVSPSESAEEETLSTLQFATRAKAAVLDGRHLTRQTTKSSVPQKYRLVQDQPESLEREVMLLRRQNAELRERLKAVQSQSFTTPQRESRSVAHSHNASVTSMSGILMPSGLRRGKSADKRVRFEEESVSERVRHKQTYDDDTEFERLSVYNEFLQDRDAEKREERKRVYSGESFEQPTRGNKFWATEKTGLSPRLARKLSGDRSGSNSLARKVQGREIERRLDEFFAGESQPQQTRPETKLKGDDLKNDPLAPDYHVGLPSKHDTVLLETDTAARVEGKTAGGREVNQSNSFSTVESLRNEFEGRRARPSPAFFESPVDRPPSSVGDPPRAGMTRLGMLEEEEVSIRPSGPSRRGAPSTMEIMKKYLPLAEPRR
eukprot:TRINITY_DN11121_c2_g2_i1.p1 TRINITY_DN11121_c2_g2~~TRINITY_DN11121_c2_g2_i1.p1  ORF type:complete len:503 (-),score=103.14 TRINITY_DN11121_c2_g2_i1:53-1561(-)